MGMGVIIMMMTVEMTMTHAVGRNTIVAVAGKGLMKTKEGSHGLAHRGPRSDRGAGFEQLSLLSTW